MLVFVNEINCWKIMELISEFPNRKIRNFDLHFLEFDNILPLLKTKFSEILV